MILRFLDPGVAKRPLGDRSDIPELVLTRTDFMEVPKSCSHQLDFELGAFKVQN